MTEWRNGFEHHLVILYLFVVGPISSRGRPDVSLNIFPIIMTMTGNDHKMKINSVLDQFTKYKQLLSAYNSLQHSSELIAISFNY